MVDVTEAIKAAREFAQKVLAEESIKNLGLEGVELDDEGRNWRVTLGFSRPWDSRRLNSPLPEDTRALASAAGLSHLFRGQALAPDRDFKVFAVDADTGRVSGMYLLEDE